MSIPVSHSPADDTAESDGEISELDKILQTLELENKQEARLLEKEHQQILALEKTFKEKQDGIESIHDALDKSDEDAKALHKQFRQNKDNAESLRKHADVLSCHRDTLETKLHQLQGKITVNREDRSTKLSHYQSIWTNYQEKYETSPLAQKWKSCHQQAELGLQDLIEQADAVKSLNDTIATMERKLKIASENREDWRTWIIEIAKTKVSSRETLEEAALCKSRRAELKQQLEAARERSKQAEQAARVIEKRLPPKELSTDRAVPASSKLKVHEKRIQPESTNASSHHFQIPQLFIPQSPRLISQSSTPRDVPPPTPPSPRTFIEIPQRFNTTAIRPPPLMKPTSLGNNYSVLQSKESSRNNHHPVGGVHEMIQEVPSLSLDERQEELTQEAADESPMETDADSIQGYVRKTASSSSATAAPITTSLDPSTEEEELSISQVREKIRNLPRSPGFQFARRPMYEHEEQSFSPVPSKVTTNSSETFLNSFFGQMASSSPSTPGTSVMNMFASPVVSEEPEDNIMSLFGRSSQEQAGGSASQEDQSAGFSFNFTPSSSSTLAETERTSFSLF